VNLTSDIHYAVYVPIMFWTLTMLSLQYKQGWNWEPVQRWSTLIFFMYLHNARILEIHLHNVRILEILVWELSIYFKLGPSKPTSELRWTLLRSKEQFWSVNYCALILISFWILCDHPLRCTSLDSRIKLLPCCWTCWCMLRSTSFLYYVSLTGLVVSPCWKIKSSQIARDSTSSYVGYRFQIVR